MSIASPWFLAFVAIVAIAYQLCASVRFRRALLSAVNVGFLVPLVPNGQSWAGFALAIVGSYLLVRMAVRRPSGWFVLVTIAAVVAGFAVLKHYAFLERVLPTNLWKHPIELVGISYMLFKFIHVFVDGWQGQLAPLNFVTYANYQLAFFTLVAGPIQRYNDFQRFWSEMGTASDGPREALQSWNRILTGLFKIGPLAVIAWYVFEQAGARFEPLRTQYPLLWFLVYMYAYPVFLYFNFSGYTDIVIGAARLLGFQLPENFNRPYLARNVIDYWNRWHISLTFWIRDYVFMTSYKAAAERFPAGAKYAGLVLLFFSLFLAGVWHGSTAGFAVFGIINGLGAVVTQVYGDLLKKWLGRSGFQRYQQNKIIRALAIFLTINFQCFSILFFSSGVQRALELIRVASNGTDWHSAQNVSATRVGLMLALATGLMVLLAILGIVWKKTKIRQSVAAVYERSFDSARVLYAFVACKAIVVTLALLVCWAITEREPVVVYMAF